jgi:hypothetical protein
MISNKIIIYAEGHFKKKKFSPNENSKTQFLFIRQKQTQERVLFYLGYSRKTIFEKVR